MYDFRSDLQKAELEVVEEKQPRIFSEKITVAYYISSEDKNDRFKDLYKPRENIPNRIFKLEAYGYDREMSFSIKKNGKYVVAESEKGEDRTLKVKINFNTVSNIFKITVIVNFQGRYSVNKILKILNIQKGIITGDIKFDGQALTENNERLTIDFDMESLDKRLHWWEKVQKIEQKMSCQIKAELPLSRKDYEKLQKLYISFVLDQPYQDYVNVKNFTTEVTDDVNVSTLLQGENTRASLSTVQMMDLKPLGIKKNIFISTNLMDLPVKKCEKDEDNGKIKVDFNNDRYNTVLEMGKLFLNKEQAEKYQPATVTTDRDKEKSDINHSGVWLDEVPFLD